MSEAPLRALVVDDEKHARKELISLLEEHGGVVVAAECEGGAEAIEVCQRHKPDVIFLDINMPEVDGIEVALNIEGAGIAIVFTTAFDHFAVRAFELGSIDYLLKPIGQQRLGQALDRVMTHASLGKRPTLDGFLRSPPDDTFVFRSMGSVVVLSYGEVLFIEAKGNYVHVHAHIKGQDRCWLYRSTFGDVCVLLESHGFVRVHRSFMLNRNQLREIKTRGKGLEAVMSNDQRIPVSRAARGRLRELGHE